MASVALKVSDEFKAKIEQFPWVNWSEAAREELAVQDELKESFERFKAIVAKSKLTEEDAIELGRKVNESLHKRYKKLYPELE